MFTIYVVSSNHKRYENGRMVSHDRVPRKITLEYSEDGSQVSVTISPTLSTKRAMLVKQTPMMLYYKGLPCGSDSLYEYTAHLRPNNTIDVFTLKRIDTGVTIEYYEI